MAELLLVAAFAAGYLGFALLALSLQRHWREVTGQAAGVPPPHAAIRLSGYAALAVAFALAVLRDGPAFGSVLGTLQLATSAVAVALTLSWRPHWLAALAGPFRRPVCTGRNRLNAGRQP